MSNAKPAYESLSEVYRSVDTTGVQGSGWKRALAFLGPAYLVSVGYMDPGNWATDIAGGSRFGYRLIWVLLMSNLMALLLQSLSARLGIVRGRDLAQANRETYPRYVNYALYVLAEVAIAATDLAEIIGMAIGIQLLTGLPLIWGVLITILDTFVFLWLQRLGMRKLEAFIIALVAIIGISFLIEILLAQPSLGEVAKGFIPSLPNEDALYITIGIIGATVMPHNLYLHSALVQTRKIRQDESGIRRALRLNFIDSAVALNLAFFVNAAILVLAGKVFYESGRTDVAEIRQAHELLAPILGTQVAPILFAVALIAAGQSSTITGTLSGQIVMEGYLHLRISPWVRRLMTRLIAIIPAVAVILIHGERDIDRLLVLSQVVLSLQLGFAIIPLIHFTSDKSRMGVFAIRRPVILLASIITAILVYLNIRMVVEQASLYLESSGNAWATAAIIAGALGYVGLLLTAIFYPMLRHRPAQQAQTILHREPEPIGSPVFVKPQYRRIAIALDFSNDDARLIGHALGQGNMETEYIFIHIVESASSRILYDMSDDLETRSDQQQLDQYVARLGAMNLAAKGILGFNDRAKEIVRITQQQQADMLVIGAHGHKGLSDLIYGQTINEVRHALTIPVLIVNL
ncbi:MAG: Mn(2+) uptake NRAMP transporter MntH [Bacteroidetes bacterium]|nr:Mn(2+) uptake NRAMP transporter MntH [Bacteroidota bacterium]